MSDACWVKRGNGEQNFVLIALPELEEFMQVWLAPPSSTICFNSSGRKISMTRSIL